MPNLDFYIAEYERARDAVQEIKENIEKSRTRVRDAHKVEALHQQVLGKWMRKERRAIERMREFLNRKAELEARTFLESMTLDSLDREANMERNNRNLRNLRRAQESKEQDAQETARDVEIERHGYTACPYVSESAEDSDEEGREEDSMEVQVEELDKVDKTLDETPLKPLKAKE